MAKIRGKTASEIRRMKFEIMNFTGLWLHKYGCPEYGFSGLWYGGSGSGKSTEVLLLSQYIAENFGKVIFNSCEEGISRTIQQKLDEYDIQSSNLLFYQDLTFEELMQVTESRGVKFVVIDSIQQMGFTNENFTEFIRHFGKTRSLLLISKVNGKGKARGGDEILHNVGIKVKVEKGLAEIRSRYLQDGHRSVRLFGKEDVKESDGRNIWNEMPAVIKDGDARLCVKKYEDNTYIASYRDCASDFVLLTSDAHFQPELALSDLRFKMMKL